MANYRLEATGPATGLGGRMGLPTADDAQAVGQMEAVRQGHEMSGESRILAPNRPEGAGWAAVARTGSRRLAGEGRAG